MKKIKKTITKNANDLAKALDLSQADAVEMDIRSDLNNKIIEIVKKENLTHEQVAGLAHTSRTRITAILNRNTHEVSTDLLLRILTNLGYKAKLTFSKAA